jgi:hypothetical protein
LAKIFIHVGLTFSSTFFINIWDKRTGIVNNQWFFYFCWYVVFYYVAELIQLLRFISFPFRFICLSLLYSETHPLLDDYPPYFYLSHFKLFVHNKKASFSSKTWIMEEIIQKKIKKKSTKNV